MNWKMLFSSAILKRGDAYYKQKRVVGYHETGSTAEAVVVGSRMYDVKITHPGEGNVRMSCTCPYARDGFYCKHMAAVMFQWEALSVARDDTGASKGKTSLDILIPKADKGREPFYHINAIVSGEIFTNKACADAQNLLAKGMVKLERFESRPAYYSYNGEEDAPAAMEGRYLPGDGYAYPLTVRFNRAEIKAYECSKCGRHHEPYYYYGSYSKKTELCSHLLALLAEADQYTKDVDPGDYTDSAGQRFLNAFSRELIRSAAEEQREDLGTVALEPRLVQSGSSYELNFRIGNGGKMYVVKNLTDLQHTVEKRGRLPLGKSGGINFASETFDEYSGRLYELIEGEVKRMEAAEEKMQSRRTYYYGGTLEAGKGIPFTGAAVDTVYELMQGRTIELKGEVRGKNSLVLKDVDPLTEIKIDITRGKPGSRHVLEKINVSGSVPALIDGVRSRYFISDGFLSRLNEDVWSRIKPFAEAADDDNRFSFIIGHRQATRFYYDVLPGLREDPSFEIEELSGIDGLIPEKADFSFWLDAEDDIILCEAEAAYGTVTEKLKGKSFETLPLADHRDLYQELPVYDLLEELFEAYDPEKEAFILEDSDDARYEMLKHGVPRLMAYGDVHSTDDFSAIRIRKSPSVQIGVSVESNLLDLDVVTQDLSYEELAALLLSYRQKKKYHRLKTGEFVDLSENESLDTLMNLLESSGADVKDFVKGKLQIPLYRALYLDKMLEGHEELVAGRDRHFRNLIRNFKTINDADFETPDVMQGVLRPYQEHGYKWLRTLETAGFGGILADDMGLGKTIQILALLQAYKDARPADNGAEEKRDLTALVVCPASVVYNWTEEIGRFTPGLRAAALAGTKSERRRILQDHREYDILVTSYDLLKRDIDLYEDVRFTHEILDEAQFIKNAKAVAAKSVKLVHADHRYALTGTPIENRLSELWSIFDYLMPGFLYGYEGFRKTFELPISKYSDERATEDLKNMIAPFILRRKKQDVLKDLPDKIEEIRYARMDEAQRRVYDGQAVRISRLIEEKGDFNTGKIEILAELTRIRQICCDPGLVLANYKGGSAKRQACIELVQSAVDGGHKILLFSQFTSMLALLESDLEEAGISFYKLTGATSKEERMRLVKAFNSDDTPVFLISLKAGGTGLNLTGADIVIHYDPWWNLAAQDQATDRAHRIGQTRDVTVFKLIAKDTIEENIVKLQETKRELADAVLSGETRSLGSLSREELLALLS